MIYKLYIAEKPSLAKTIASHMGGGTPKKGHIIGDGWIMTWCFGHLYRLFKPEEYDIKYKDWSNIDLLPIVPETWKTTVDDSKKEQVDLINRLISGAESVVHVGDPDNEGQYLVDLVIRKSGYQGAVYRLWPDDLSPTGLDKCFANIKSNQEYRGHSLAAEYRGKADWLIGINFTRLFTYIARKSGYRDVVSLGRVQSPTHSLVVVRCRDISSFKPTFHFGVTATFNVGTNTYSGTWIIPDDLKSEGLYLLDKGQAENVANIISNKNGVILSVKNTQKSELAPLPFNLTKLQALANKKWKLSGKETLNIAQKLYDDGYLTYPRSDCRYLSEGDFRFAESIVRGLHVIEQIGSTSNAQSFNKKPKCYNDKKTTAHTAIVPTSKVPDLSKLSDIEREVYIAVAVRFTSQFLPPFAYISTTVITKVEDHSFKSTSKHVTDVGWKTIEEAESSDVDNDVLDTPFNLSSLSDGTAVVCSASELNNKKTSPPKYFTEGSLIEAMGNIANFVDNVDIKKRLKESDGIGTEATRADIIDRLKKVNYDAVKSNGDIISTKVGYKVYDAFPEALKDPSMTALWEAALKRIESGDADHNQFLKQQIEWLRVQIKKIRDNMPILELKEPSKFKCNVCDRPMVRIKGKSSFFWSCAGYPDDCKNSLSDHNGKPLYPIDGDGDACTECTKGVMKTRIAKPKGKPAKTFLGCSNYPDCKHSVWPK